ncbi:hypothetical protein WMY93_010060 [Mugilogobius chulae]|uniref:Uncharacterized protein n=1 Tax=Mugilogobius chulae TaxID=88201 RepID=A0AAW0PHS7_9GOBI
MRKNANLVPDHVVFCCVLAVDVVASSELKLKTTKHVRKRRAENSGAGALTGGCGGDFLRCFERTIAEFEEELRRSKEENPEETGAVSLERVFRSNQRVLELLGAKAKNMSANLALKTLVQERLTAAAEEIFALFERTIAEFEEELRRSKEENQKKQELLEAVLNPSVVLFRESVQIQPTSPGAGLNPGLNQDLETPQTQIKEEPEEPRVKQEEEQRCDQVKTEESLQLQQKQTELREETQEEDASTETQFQPEPEKNQTKTRLDKQKRRQHRDTISAGA